MSATAKKVGTFNLAEEIFPKPKTKGQKPKTRASGQQGSSEKTSVAEGSPSVAPAERSDAQPVKTTEIVRTTSGATEQQGFNLEALLTDKFVSLQKDLKGFVTELVDQKVGKRDFPEQQDLPANKKTCTEVDTGYNVDTLFSDPPEEGEVEDDFMDELAEDYASTNDVGPAVTPKIGDLINGVFKSKLPDEKAKELGDNYKRPENVRVGSALINPEIWSSLSSDRRGDDVKLQKAGASIANANHALCNLLQLLYEGRTDTENLDIKHAIKVGMDAVALNCLALHRLADYRRNSIRPTINPQYRAICAKQDNESHELLFGGELTQRLKDRKETVKVGATCHVSQKASTQRSFSGRRGAAPNTRSAPPRRQWQSNYQQTQTPRGNNTGYRNKAGYRNNTAYRNSTGNRKRQGPQQRK